MAPSRVYINHKHLSLQACPTFFPTVFMHTNATTHFWMATKSKCKFLSRAHLEVLDPYIKGTSRVSYFNKQHYYTVTHVRNKFKIIHNALLSITRRNQSGTKLFIFFFPKCLWNLIISVHFSLLPGVCCQSALYYFYMWFIII